VTNSNVTIRNTGIYRNTASLDGSAIFARNNSSITILNSVVEGNSERGSAIILDRGRLDASNSLFVNNTATLKGSTIYAGAGTAVTLQNSTFRNNNGFDSGGVYSLGRLDVSNCVFDGGKSEKAGGAIVLGNGSNGNIRNSIFTNGTAKDDGGGIHVAVEATASIISCTFTNNIASYGGAVFGRGNVRMEQCTAVNNTARVFGGAVAVWNNADFTLEKNIIAGNKALSNNSVRDVGGGGLNISNSRALIANNIIVGNTDPRSVDFGQQNATVRSDGKNLVGLYRDNGTGRFPIHTTDVDGLAPETLFVWDHDRPALTRPTGALAGYENVQVYTAELNSSPNNPAYDVLGDINPPPPTIPSPGPGDGDNETNQTPQPSEPKPPTNVLGHIKTILIIAAVICVLIVAVVVILKLKRRRDYKF
jgi:hypothetical protein